MSNIFYGGTPVEHVDFEKEYEKELAELESKIAEMKAKKASNSKFNHEYWTIKLVKANKALEVGQVTLS